jgi:hypothetical protein
VSVPAELDDLPERVRAAAADDEVGAPDLRAAWDRGRARRRRERVAAAAVVTLIVLGTAATGAGLVLRSPPAPVAAGEQGGQARRGGTEIAPAYAVEGLGWAGSVAALRAPALGAAEREEVYRRLGPNNRDRLRDLSGDLAGVRRLGTAGPYEVYAGPWHALEGPDLCLYLLFDGRVQPVCQPSYQPMANIVDLEDGRRDLVGLAPDGFVAASVDDGPQVTVQDNLFVLSLPPEEAAIRLFLPQGDGITFMVAPEQIGRRDSSG